jgi:zinc protease
MQFKGTPQFPAGVLDKAVSRDGGVWNAFTYMDWTTYFQTMPADKIDLGIRLEADRMVNSNFDPDEVASERTVIISERQGNENQPMFLLGEAVQAAAFRVHPYHHQIIGDMADLQTISRTDLYNHYKTYYVPGNAVAVVTGDFDTDVMQGRIQELYEPISQKDMVIRPVRPEPAPKGEHRLAVEGPGETRYILASYHSPAATDPDFFPFIVLDSLLTGPSSLNLFGGGISNNTSRLYRSLVEGEVAVSVNGSLPATIDPFIYSITVTVHPEKTAEDAITVLDDQIKLIQDELPGEDALERAVKQARALFAYGSESITNQAFWLGFTKMFASHEWFDTYLDNLAAVTPEDIQRIAQDYLNPNNRVLGTYIPTGNNTEVPA